MKMITAVLRSEQLTAVKQSLFDANIRSMTVMPVLGTAPNTEQQKFRGVAREVSLFQRVRLELTVPDAQKEQALEAISAAAKDTGGWGRIFVQDVEDAVTIWTGERGEGTLREVPGDGTESPI
jgi:nitrogen regulatory protein PII